MTYKEKLSVIGEKLTTDKTLADLMVRLQNNQRNNDMLAIKNIMGEVSASMATYVKEDNVSVVELEKAVVQLNTAIYYLNKIAVNDALIEMLYDCVGEKERETK